MSCAMNLSLPGSNFLDACLVCIIGDRAHRQCIVTLCSTIRTALDVLVFEKLEIASSTKHTARKNMMIYVVEW